MEFKDLPKECRDALVEMWAELSRISVRDARSDLRHGDYIYGTVDGAFTFENLESGEVLVWNGSEWRKSGVNPA